MRLVIGGAAAPRKPHRHLSRCVESDIYVKNARVRIYAGVGSCIMYYTVYVFIFRILYMYNAAWGH